jgi:hypothetical protein
MPGKRSGGKGDGQGNAGRVVPAGTTAAQGREGNERCTLMRGQEKE